jgi:hypothetical protein
MTKLTLFGGDYRPAPKSGQPAAATNPQAKQAGTNQPADESAVKPDNTVQLALGLTLDLAPLVQPKVVKGATLRERFESFHRLNPHVAENLFKLAKRAKDRGVKRWAVKALIEHLRWQTVMQTEGEVWKINNNHAPFYARLLMKEHQELDGFFETRKLSAKSEKQPEIE